VYGGGTIYGNGNQYWYGHRELKVKPPRLIGATNVENIKITHLRLRDAPYWTIHLFRVNKAYISHIDIQNLLSANTDGIDIDSSKRVVIEFVRLSVRDDVIAFKANDKNVPNSFHHVRHSYFYGDHGRGGALAFGSETQGGISNIIIQNCTFTSAGTALYFKTNPSRGGFIKNIIICDIFVFKSHQAIFFDTSYGGISSGKTLSAKRCTNCGSFSNYTFISNISFSRIFIDSNFDAFRTPGTLSGSPKIPLHGLSFSHISLSDFIDLSTLVNRSSASWQKPSSRLFALGRDENTKDEEPIIPRRRKSLEAATFRRCCCTFATVTPSAQHLFRPETRCASYSILS